MGFLYNFFPQNLIYFFENKKKLTTVPPRIKNNVFVGIFLKSQAN